MPKYRFHSGPVLLETQTIKLLLSLWKLCSWFLGNFKYV